MKVFKRTISCILATSIACSMFATTVFAMGDMQDVQEEQAQSTQ